MGLYTQQDPIGIAGGLNLYGYADGDPVNRGDPFGLTAEQPDESQSTGPCDGYDSAWECVSALRGQAEASGDSCAVYGDHWVGSICQRASAPGTDNWQNDCAAQCLETAWSRLLLSTNGQSPTVMQSLGYLFRDHVGCYWNCGYTVFDFAVDWLTGYGTRSREGNPAQNACQQHKTCDRRRK
jgi:hypothetical protein